MPAEVQASFGSGSPWTGKQSTVGVGRKGAYADSSVLFKTS